ncbi:MAG: hypothetical protein CR988_03010 [Treponema sp.]|nr:MAG: hypothetical protein CR988_03010 [Treponema sp.]
MILKKSGIMQRKFKIYHILRSLSLLMISLIPALYFSEIIPLLVLPVFTIILIFSCLFMKNKNVKAFSAFIVLVISFLLLWISIMFLLWLIQSPPVDVLYIRLKMILPFSILLAVFVFFTTSVNLNSYAYRKYEPIIFIMVFVFSFWSQGRYNLQVFDRTITAMGFAVLFFLLTLIQLFLCFNFRKKNTVFFAIFIPFFLGLMVLFLYFYNMRAVSNTGGILKQSMFKFDFSDYLTLKEEIKLTDKLLMIVHTPQEDAHNMLRRLYLSGWSPKKGFFEKKAPDENAQILDLPGRPTSIEYKEFPNRKKVKQEYFLVNLGASSLIAMDYPVMVYPYEVWDTVRFNSAYMVESMTLDIYNYDLTADFPTGDVSEGLSKDDLEFYTSIDLETKNWILPIAEKAVKDVDGYYDTIRALWEFLAEGEYKYSLKPGKAKDGNQLKYFLTESKKAYCSYFAFAYCLMLRSLGIPSRVAVGFFISEKSEIMNYFPVRANVAHAWVEVFFPHSGWVSFDPTTSQVAEGEGIEFGEATADDEFKGLLNEILENREFLKYKNEIDELSDEKNSFTKVVSNFLKSRFTLLTISFFIILSVCIFLFFLYPYFIIRFSKNNRKIILTIYKLAQNKKCTTQELFVLMQKAKFSNECTEEDVKKAKHLFKSEKKM